MKSNLKLKDIIDIQSLQKIQDSIANVIEMALITVDTDGKPITEHSRCCEFCSKMRSDDKYKKLCEECDLEAGIKSANFNKIYIHKCHAGLVDFAIPIIVDGIYLGAVMTGQVIISDEENIIFDDNKELNTKFIENCNKSSELLSSYKNIHIVTTEKIAKVTDMMSNITNYIVEEALLKITQEEKNKLQKEYKIAKLKALKSQINPHFLFNVLNSMSALSIIENAPKTQRVILSISKMLRYTLKKSNKLVTIDEEINYIKSYLDLQKIRFEERIEYDIYVEEKLKNVKIPFMCIQVFVENAIIHGIEPSSNKGHINISVESNKDRLIITVEDDGVGIEKVKLNRLREMLTVKEGEFDEIGINNVNKRMSYYYNDLYNINIYSFKEKGTKVNIIIEDWYKYV